MRKLFLNFIIFVSLIGVSSCVFAAVLATNGSGYSSSQTINKKLTLLTRPLYQRTNITVINYTQNPIYVKVFDAIHNLIESGYSNTITNDNELITPIILTDRDGKVFFQPTPGVCERALVIVDDIGGLYHMNVDTRFCNK